MRECEAKLKSVQLSRASRLARDWQVSKRGTRVKHAEELKTHASCCTTGQKSQVGQAVSSRLELAT